MGLFDNLKKKTDDKVEEVKKDVETLAKEVMKGAWGNTDDEIKKNLEKAGYDTYLHVKSKVNELTRLAEKAKKEAEEKLKEAELAKKLAKVEDIAKEVIEGKWGNGEERKQKLKEAGYDFTEIQTKVNELLAPAKKSVEEVAKEVIQGKWGNGEERKQKLKEAGYDFTEVQTLVNKLLG